jgi:phytoene dehydrogenase-like protein
MATAVTVYDDDAERFISWQDYAQMTNSSTDIIIIGAGIAGLAAGCYAQMNGYQTRIFEMHNLPGGLCTAWQTTYDYWQRIYGRSLYDTEQIQESNIVIDYLEQIYPGIKADIEFVDVATPLSYERYTGNWQGSSCGWLLTKQTLPLMIKGLPKILPKLKNFYMIGQWVEPGGSVPVVAMSGRNLIQQICHEDRKVFRADATLNN